MPRIGPWTRHLASAYVSVIVTVVHCGALPSLGWAEGTLGRVAQASPDTVRPAGIVPTPQAAEMHRAILDAARSGRIDELKTPLEWNELKPEIAAGAVDDPIAYWRKLSKDGEGQEILAALIAILELPPAVVGGPPPAPGSASGKKNKGAPAPPDLYVWPYLAARPLGSLTADEEADLLRLMTPEEAKAMKTKGKYTSWRLGIGADGTWHFFIRDEP